MKYSQAPEVKRIVDILVDKLGFDYVQKENVHCIRSYDANTRAIARIWGIPKLFKDVLGMDPHYIIEVNSKRFDKLDDKEKIKTLIHELLHIPKTFSGALLSHKGRYHRINNKVVEKLYNSITL